MGADLPLGVADRTGAPDARSSMRGPTIALIGVLALGLGLRIWLIHSWQPAFVGHPDSFGYLDAAFLRGANLLFSNPYHPAGYPLFLSLVHKLGGGLAFTIDIQHLMGLLAAVLLYLAVARFVRRRWVALLPASVVTFAGSELYLEHAALAETLYTFLIIAAVFSAAQSYERPGLVEACWLAAAGILIGLCGPVRSTGIFVAPALIGWAAITRPSMPERLRAAAIVTACFTATLGGYLVYQHATTGTWGLTRTAGESLYARTAVFADCHDFTPPAGTKVLCQPPHARRHDPSWYMFAPLSPLQQSFGGPPVGGSYKWPPNSKLEAFGIAAITHQPWQYAWTTIQGLVKYIAPDLGPSYVAITSHSHLIDQLHDPQGEANARYVINGYYGSDTVAHHSLSTLDAYAQAARVEGPVTAVLVVLMLAGFGLARDRRRVAAGLFGWTTAVLLVAPVALLAYGARYATPAYGPLTAAAAIGLDAVIDRTNVARRSRRSAMLPHMWGRPG